MICLRHAAVIEGGRAAIKEILFRHGMNLLARMKSWLDGAQTPLWSLDILSGTSYCTDY